MATQIQIRRDTQENWDLANPTLAEGEFGLVTSSNKIVALKVGDGSSVWQALEFSLPVMSGVDNTLEPNAANTAPLSQVTTFSLKGVPGQTSQMLGIKKHDDTVTFSVDQDGDVVVEGDINLNGDIILGDGGIIKSAEVGNPGWLIFNSAGPSLIYDASHYVHQTEAGFVIKGDADITDGGNLDVVAGNVSAVNVSGSGVLNMTGAAEHNLNGELDMRTHKILNVVDPTTNQGAATRQYVDDAIAANKGWKFLETVTGSGNTMESSVFAGDLYAAIRIYWVDMNPSQGQLCTSSWKIGGTYRNSFILSSSTNDHSGYVEMINPTSDTGKVVQYAGVTTWNDNTSTVFGPATALINYSGNVTQFKFFYAAVTFTSGKMHVYGLLL